MSQYDRIPFVDRALPLAGRGLLVIPVRPKGKEVLLQGWPLLATNNVMGKKTPDQERE